MMYYIMRKKRKRPIFPFGGAILTHKKTVYNISVDKLLNCAKMLLSRLMLVG